MIFHAVLWYGKDEDFFFSSAQFRAQRADKIGMPFYLIPGQKKVPKYHLFQSYLFLWPTFNLVVWQLGLKCLKIIAQINNLAPSNRALPQFSSECEFSVKIKVSIQVQPRRCVTESCEQYQDILHHVSKRDSAVPRFTSHENRQKLPTLKQN